MKFSDVFYWQYFAQLLKYKTFRVLCISYILEKGNEKKGICLEEVSIPKREKVQEDECMEVREMLEEEDNNPFPSLNQQYVSGKESIVPWVKGRQMPGLGFATSWDLLCH